jgi:hypothetical protein
MGAVAVMADVLRMRGQEFNSAPDFLAYNPVHVSDD